MGLVVGVLAVGAALMGQTAARGLRRAMPYLTRISGALLVVVGAHVGWYGWYELRVYAGGSAEDPVVSAAAAVQSRLAQWVDGIGATAFAAILFITVGAVIGARAVTARRAARASAESKADRSG